MGIESQGLEAEIEAWKLIDLETLARSVILLGIGECRAPVRVLSFGCLILEQFLVIS